MNFLSNIFRNIYFQLILLITVLVILHIAVYQYVKTSETGQLWSWREVVRERGALLDKTDYGVEYVIEGTLAEIYSSSIAVEVDGAQETFITPFTKFTVVTPFNVFEEWPEKVVIDNDSGYFKKGDKIKMLIKVAPPLKIGQSSPYRIIKTQTESI